MGKQLIDKMLPSVAKAKLPANSQTTMVGLKSYEEGLYQVDVSRNAPKKLADALRTFQSGGCAPYYCAGIAYALISASKETHGGYYQKGLQAALDWLEKAQSFAPDQVEINIWEALIYTYWGRLDDARMVLDYLQQQGINNFYLARGEIAYWLTQNDPAQVERWYQDAFKRAPNGIMKLHLQNEMADFYAGSKQWNKAIDAYRHAINLQRGDPRLWHKLSAVYWQMDDLDEAARCNKRSLALGALPEATQLAQEIQQKMGSGSLVGKLFGRG